MNEVLEIKNLSFKYKEKDNLILENINCIFKSGEMVAIIGPSGVGKSTLFKLIVRNKKPTLGSILFNNKNIDLLTKKEWKNIIKKIGFLIQEPCLIEEENVYLNIKRSINDYKNKIFKLINYLTREQRIKIFSILDDLNILDKSFYKVSDLSGGQKQRVEIAKLLVKNVKLILADEPTSNLDNATSRDVLSILKKLTKEKNILCLVNTHDLNLALEFFDRIIVLNNKNIVFNKKNEGISICDLENMIQKVK
ncbi:phosphonate ABC transporter ATP-binding protein [Mycoplasma elephantis]|uniref:phosphonate ABC transporter ATP-binding protein n=1 Tax=Mycoplasma elephantis TaxID=114882 RepID=UPI000489DF42|nr:ATP-binding cassette domain-containing protein [Mycoplasma elephantis]